ncbi:hypothetical protein ACFE04_027462 [Oxalis oulophora]
MASFFITLFVLSLAIIFTSVAADPDLLQDICVADTSSGAKQNGFACKETVEATDFYSQILATPGVTNATAPAVVTGANVMKVPGLNTQGVSLSRIDYAPGGVNPPHIHPRASEVVYVLEGDVEVGFITTANVLHTANLKKGDLFVFPRALVHYQKNTGTTAASVLAAFNSQLPGTQSIGVSLFGASPCLPDEVLASAFKLAPKDIGGIKAKFPSTK